MKYLIIFIGLIVSACSVEPNAMAYSDRIVIVGDFDEFAQNQTERSFILAHEVGHIILGHTEILLWSHTELKDRELAADKFAIDALNDNGHDICLINNFFERIIENRPKLYKPLELRIKQVKMACEKKN